MSFFIVAHGLGNEIFAFRNSGPSHVRAAHHTRRTMACHDSDSFTFRDMLPHAAKLIPLTADAIAETPHDH